MITQLGRINEPPRKAERAVEDHVAGFVYDYYLSLWEDGGGEVAAAKLTGYLKPGTVTLYADKHRFGEFVVANRLIKDPQGNIEILERFWPLNNDFGEGDTVHPIIIYADLVAIGDQRTMETARIIYEQHIDKYFRQD